MEYCKLQQMNDERVLKLEKRYRILIYSTSGFVIIAAVATLISYAVKGFSDTSHAGLCGLPGLASAVSYWQSLKAEKKLRNLSSN